MLGRRVQRGFTLIELMFAIALAGILLAAGLPTMGVWLENVRVRNVAESVLAGLQKARAEAVGRNSPVQFVLNGADSGWVVSCVAITPGCPNTNSIETRAAGEGASSGMTVTATDGRTVQFNSFGVLVSPLPVAPANYISFQAVSAKATRIPRIDVYAGGNVRMCDPAVTATGDPRRCKN